MEDATASSREEKETRGLVAPLSMLFARRWIVLSTTVLVTLAVGAWTMQQREVYAASCTLSYGALAHPPGLEHDAIAHSNARTNDWILTSRSLNEQVVLKLRLHHDADFMDVPAERRASWKGASVSAATKKLQARLRIVPERGTDLTHVVVEDTDPERAAQVANAVAGAFVERIGERRTDSTKNALQLLTEQLDSVRERLENSELALQTLRAQDDALYTSLEERQRLLAETVQHYNTELTRVRIAQIQQEARLAELKAARAHDPLYPTAEPFVQDPAIQELRHQYRDLLLQRAASASDTQTADAGPAHLDLQLIALRTQIEQELDRVVQTNERNLEELKKVERSVRSALAEAREEGLRLGQSQLEHERLNRTRKDNAELYSTLLARIAQADVATAAKVAAVSIVEEAVAPNDPVRPVLWLNLALGVLGGMVLGMGLAWIAPRRAGARTRANVSKRTEIVLGGISSPADTDLRESGFLESRSPRMSAPNPSEGTDR